MAEDADSVKEVLVKKSADYAGRPPFYSFVSTTLGMYIDLSIFILQPNTDTWLSQIYGQYKTRTADCGPRTAGWV